MCCLTEVRNFQPSEGGGTYKWTVIQDTRIGDERDIHVLIRARFKETNFTTSDSFFSRYTKDEDLPSKVISLDYLRRYETGGQRGRGNEVMTTGVTEIRQRI